MNKPIIFIDRQKFLLPDTLRKNVQINYKINFSLKKFKIFKQIKNIYTNNRNKFNWSVYIGENRKEKSNFHYYGLECSLKDFEKNFTYISKNFNKKRNVSIIPEIKDINPRNNLRLYEENKKHILKFLNKNNSKKKYLYKKFLNISLFFLEYSVKLRLFLKKNI